MSTKLHLEVFQSEWHMLKFFGAYLPKLDVNASGRLAPFLYSYDGKLVLARNLYEFLKQMEALTALGIDPIASVQKNKAFLIFFNGVPKDASKFVLQTEREATHRANVVASATKEIHVEELITTSVPETTVVEPEPEVKEEFSPEKAEIIAQALALRDDSKKSASKAALEAFALEKGVSLTKSKTFDGMIEDLKAAL